MQTSTPPKQRLATPSQKDHLFEDFFANVVSTAERLERLFGLTAVEQQIFGSDVDLRASDLSKPKEALRANRSWLLVSELYDYAVDGVCRVGTKNSQSDGESSLVIDAGEVIALLSGEEARPTDDWHQIVKMADARVALTENLPLDVERIALLASVDVRTVRNAISSGALPAEDGLIGCADARAWLLGRKGYKPTIYEHELATDLPSIDSAEQFAALLRQCRTRRAQEVVGTAEAGQDILEVDLPLDAYAGLTQEALREAEAGVFRVPLTHTNGMADFYGLPREDFLHCVMRVFYPEQLAILVRQVHSREAQ